MGGGCMLFLFIYERLLFCPPLREVIHIKCKVHIIIKVGNMQMVYCGFFFFKQLCDIWCMSSPLDRSGYVFLSVLPFEIANVTKK